MHVDGLLLERMAEKRLLGLSDAVTKTLKEQYPKQCRILGDAELKSFCDECVTKAYKYGASNYGELRSYTALAWVLGSGFDDDPLLPWAQEILESEELFENKIEDMTNRVHDVYYFATLKKLQEYQDALNRLLGLDFSDIKKFTSYVDVVRTLEYIYPQRVEALGGRDLLKERLKVACYEKTIRYNIDHPIGIFVYASLVFFLGHKVDDDPLFGWAKKYLNDDEPRMAHKLDRLVKVIEKRVRNMHREIEAAVEELI